jgi:hypothetical protein
MSLPWFRMYAEFATDPKIQALAFEDQRHFIVLLCLKGNGTLDSHTGTDAFRERMIAHGLRLSEKGAEEAKARLQDAGLIDAQWQPIAWGKRQHRSDLDPTNAERQRKYRLRHRNVTVTGLDTDTEVDLEEERKRFGGPKGRHPKAEEIKADLSRLTEAQRLRISQTKT